MRRARSPERAGSPNPPRSGRRGSGSGSQAVQRVHRLRVERGDRLWRERHAPTVILAGANVQLVVNEVELDLERVVSVRDRRGRQAAWADVQGDVPAVVDHRRVGHADLSDDLGPHVRRVPGVGPIRPPQPRPRPAQVGALLGHHVVSLRLRGRVMSSRGVNTRWSLRSSFFVDSASVVQSSVEQAEDRWTGADHPGR
jgi:hypothetical protein